MHAAGGGDRRQQPGQLGFRLQQRGGVRVARPPGLGRQLLQRRPRIPRRGGGRGGVLPTASVEGAAVAEGSGAGSVADGLGDGLVVPSASASACWRTAARSGASPASVTGWAAATSSYRASRAALVRTPAVRSLCSGLVRTVRAVPVRPDGDRSSPSQPASTPPAASAPAAVSAPCASSPCAALFSFGPEQVLTGSVLK